MVSDDHAGLKAAIRERIPEAKWQRCYVHFLRNALDYLPRKADDDYLRELRWLYERRTPIVRIFPDTESCLRLIHSLSLERHEEWLESHRYLNMMHLKEHKKAELHRLEEAA